MTREEMLADLAYARTLAEEGREEAGEEDRRQEDGSQGCEAQDRQEGRSAGRDVKSEKGDAKASPFFLCAHESKDLDALSGYSLSPLPLRTPSTFALRFQATILALLAPFPLLLSDL